MPHNQSKAPSRMTFPTYALAAHLLLTLALVRKVKTDVMMIAHSTLHTMETGTSSSVLPTMLS